VETLQKRKGFNIDIYDIVNKRQILRNCVEPELGIHILNSAINVGNNSNTSNDSQMELF
jgi:DNA (cytosine-5)-methyltransferase 1